MTENTLFSRLRDSCAEDWRGYVEHPFVQGIQDGTLPEACFKHYLVQDYLFLIQFARAYSLAAYKADTLEDLKYAADGIRVITEVEMGLHVEYCKGWGVSESDMQAAPEAEDNMAYTRYVLERGMAGDLLDLHVALLPCMYGYAEIGERLYNDPQTKRDGNPYLPWIEMYASEPYLEGAKAGLATLDRLYSVRAGEGRIPHLIQTFRQATRLETRFWQMGLDAGM